MGATIHDVRILRVAILGLLVLGGCQASVKADVNAGDKKKVQDFDKPLEQPQQADVAEDDEQRFALLGARHDLHYAGEPRAKCECLAVALGDVDSVNFGWEGRRPRLNHENQVVVSLTSRNVPCASEKKNLAGASYRGYRRNGVDVIVMVENAAQGRPLTNGAIIPRPSDGGAVFVEPASRAVPFGRSLTGKKGLCRIGSPVFRSDDTRTTTKLGAKVPPKRESPRQY